MLETLPIILRLGSRAKSDLSHMGHPSKSKHLPDRTESAAEDVTLTTSSSRNGLV